MKRFLSLVFAVTCVFSEAAQVQWWKLETRFTYRDLVVFCDDGFGPRPLYLSAEIEGNKIQRMILWNNLPSVLARNTTLSGDELTLSKVENVNGSLWLSQLHLAAQTLNWLFFNAGSSLEECRPSTPLATLGPNYFTFEFSPGTEAVLTSHGSTVGNFHGRLTSGGAYHASLWFTQSQARLPR